MKIYQKDNDIYIEQAKDFELAQTLDCGQAFRWIENEDKSFTGVAFNKICTIYKIEDTVILKDTSLDDFNNIWKNYFDLDTDYSVIKAEISRHPVLAKAAEFAPGIRVLRQDSWEALCTFIISQNNNIKRIKGIVERLCQSFGDEIMPGYFSFPTAQKLAGLSVEDLAPLRSGFRARYIIDAAKRVAGGEIDLELIKTIDIDLARKELMKITGVGIKVADCALLFGFARLDCFPVDVWIRRAVTHLIPEGLPEYAMPYAGIVQQYIFHYVRVCSDALPPEISSKN